MHEASIVNSLLELVAARAPAGSTVRTLHVRVGRFTGVSPDAMQFYFEVLRDERLGEQAQLVVEQPLLSARCQACGRPWSFSEPEWICPKCGGGLVYTNGAELDLVAIEVEDAANDRD